MSAVLKKYAGHGLRLCSGGAAYGIIEVLWRGYTHISMIILGGICFDLLARLSKSNRCLAVKSLIGGLCITTAEFITGCVVNLWLGLSVWDYTKEPCQFMGQICIRFTILWILLCFIILPLFRLASKRRTASRPRAAGFSRSRTLRRLGIILHNTK